MSSDAGGAWSKVDTYFDDGYALTWDSTDTNIVYAGGQYKVGATYGFFSITKSTDGGLTWTNSRTQLGSNDHSWSGCHDIELLPSDHTTLYAVGADGLDGKVYRSTDAGDAWTDRSGNLDALNPSSWRAYAVCFNGNETIFVGADGGVFYSTNAGVSWTATDLTRATVDLLYDPTVDIMYAATRDYGVYHSTDGGFTWQTINDGLDMQNCMVLGLSPDEGYLFVGTDGGGVYRMDLSIVLQITAVNGTTDPAAGTYTNNYGTQLALTVSPNAYYHFDGWSGSTNAITGGDANSTSVTVTITEPVSLTATCDPDLAALGTPHWWLAQNGMTNNFDAAELTDDDGDSALAWQEYVADTEPDMAGSALAIVTLENSTNGIRVTWQGGQAARQFLEYRDDLLSTSQTWKVIYTNEPPTLALTNFLDSTAAVPHRFYRIRATR